MVKQPAAYILASGRNGTHYVGVTSDLAGRIWQHKNDVVPGFSRTYRIHQLVWFETDPDMLSAISREKRIKTWNRAWKIDSIEGGNPYWNDLWTHICEHSQDAGFPPARE